MRYLVSPDNRLRIETSRLQLHPRGTFSVDQHNRLAYWLNEPPAWRRMYDLPGKIVFSGQWKLDPEHNLRLELDEKRGGQSGQLTLRGSLLAAESDRLVFALKSGEGAYQSSVRLLQLRGRWGSDEANRLCFYLSRTKAPDTLTLHNSWQVNANQQLEYRYTRTDLARREKREHCLEFSGYWSIGSARQIRYCLAGSDDSRFDFQVRLETPTLYPSGNKIKYRIGIGAAGPAARQKEIILTGAWKIGRRLDVSFEMAYAHGRVRSCAFGAQADASRRDSVALYLKSEGGADTGMRLVLTRRFLRQLDAELFLRLDAARKEKRAEAGLTIPF